MMLHEWEICFVAKFDVFSWGTMSGVFEVRRTEARGTINIRADGSARGESNNSGFMSGELDLILLEPLGP